MYVTRSIVKNTFENYDNTFFLFIKKKKKKKHKNIDEP